MKPSLPLVIPVLLSTLTTITALPIPTTYKALSKRATSSHNLGIGFAVTLSIIFFAVIVFYLGVRRGKSGTWFCWRDPIPARSPTALSEKISIVDPDQFKTRISCPVPIHSTALPELSPVEAEEQSPKFLELSHEENVVYEMGEPSPKRPLSTITIKTFRSTKTARKSHFSIKTYRRSHFSTKTHRKTPSSATTKTTATTRTNRKSRTNRQTWFDRKSWFCQGAAEVEDEEKKLREKTSIESIDTLPVYPGSAVVKGDRQSQESQNEMDWTGMEWLKKAYVGGGIGRKSGYAGRKSGYKSGFRSVSPNDER